MAQEGGLFASFWRFITFNKMRQALALRRAADKQFTGSTSGIADAFDLQQDQMIEQYKELRAAISEIEAVTEDKRIQLENLNEEESELIRKRDGALAKAEEAQEASDNTAFEKHSGAYERFDTRITTIEETQERLQGEISDSDETMKKYLFQLTEMQAEVERMPAQKAEAMADFVSAQKIIELNDRLQGLQTSFDRGPLQAVLDANKKLTAKARISEKLAGTDVRLQDQEYANVGSKSKSKAKLEDILAARKAEKDGKSKRKTKTADDRPKI